MYKVNCIGDICPVPVIKVKKALADISDPSGLEILVDNEIAVQNISKFLNSLGHSFTSEKDRDFFLIKINESTSLWEVPEHPQSSDIVVISSQFMGTGDDELGKLLIKGFIFALTQLDALPTSIIFYNGGIHHVLKNSESINDLQYLQNHGAKILVCGTCLNHFDALGDLAVGDITNMYEIVTLMQQADNIIRP